MTIRVALADDRVMLRESLSGIRERAAGIMVVGHVSPSTVETHRRNIMRKLQAHAIAELTKYAVREGLTSA